MDGTLEPEPLLPHAAPELQLGPTFIGTDDAVAVRVTVNIGQVRNVLECRNSVLHLRLLQVGVELQRARAKGMAAEPLARFTIANLWVLYTSTPTGRSHVNLSLPTVEGVDLRTGVPPEQVR